MFFRALAAAAAAAAARVPGSPLPFPSRGLNASTTLLYITADGLSPSDALTLATLQGALTRRLGRATLYRASTGSDYADLWAPELAAGWGVAFDRSLGGDVWAAVARFNASLAGYFIADLADGSVNAAVALCAARGGAVAVTAEGAPRAAAAGLAPLGDVRGRGLAWVLATAGAGAFSTRVTLLQDPTKTGMSDWAVASGALTWWVPDANAGLAPLVWGSMKAPFFALGWGPDERGTVNAASAHGGGVIATDWAENLDALSAFDAPRLAPRAPPPPPPPPSAPRHTAAFLLSDGDNVQWLLGGFARSTNFFGSPDRGAVPMGWTIAPSLVDLAPAAMRYFYDRATPLDAFVGGLSGAAYAYLDDAAGAPAGFAALTLATAQKAGLEYVNVMTDGDTLAPGAAAALLGGDSALAGLIHYSYADYALGGNITFVGAKPVVRARFNLWGDGSMGRNFFNTTQAAAALAAGARDPSVAAGYSLVVVHAWSHNVSDARRVMDDVNARAPGGVDFVTPTELMRRVAANVRR